MSNQKISNQRISHTLKVSKTSQEYSSNGNRNSSRIYSKQNYLVSNLESSAGNTLQRSTDNQSICTCGKWKMDTHSTYNNTIQTNLRSDENCTCDEGRDISSLCNCYKNHTNKTSKNAQSYNSKNILIQENNYCTCGQRQNIIPTFESQERIINTNVSTEDNTNNHAKITKKICICGKGDHEAELINTTTSNNEFHLDTLETKDEEERERFDKIKNIKQEKTIIKKEQLLKSQELQKSEILSWTGDIFIQIIERLQYLAAQPPLLHIQCLKDLMIDRTLDNRPIQVLVPIPDNFIQKQCQFEVLAEQGLRNEDLCPENVELLNISHAYSIPVPGFNNLEVENAEMFIQAQPKELLMEQYSLFCQGEKKELQIANHNWDISATGRMWSGPIKPVRTNKFEIEEVIKEDWNDLIQEENIEKFEVEKLKVNYRFKQIELGNNEVITLKATKRILKDYTQTEESNVTMGGKGFILRTWEPVPFLANSMTIVRESKNKNLQITSDNMEMAPARKRRANWNLVNTSSLETSVNYLTKEKILEEQNVNPLTIIEEGKDKNKWKQTVRKQNGIKLTFGKKVKKFDLSIKKEINLFFEREIDDVIVNDDYNNIAGPQTRPIVVTVIKVNEEEDTSSVTSYDVFKNLIIQKSNLNIEFGSNSNMAQQNIMEFNRNISSGGSYGFNLKNKNNKISGTFGNGEFSYFGKKEGGVKLRMEENRQKSQYDKTVKNIVFQTKNIMGNMLGLGGKQKNIEFVREDPDVKNYLKV